MLKVPFLGCRCRWIERWPSLAALAAATQEEVNQLWSGLGYYRRARYLLEGAQYIQVSMLQLAWWLSSQFSSALWKERAVPIGIANNHPTDCHICCNEWQLLVSAGIRLWQMLR